MKSQKFEPIQINFRKSIFKITSHEQWYTSRRLKFINQNHLLKIKVSPSTIIFSSKILVNLPSEGISYTLGIVLGQIASTQNVLGNELSLR